jgi:hypothetical protein
MPGKIMPYLKNHVTSMALFAFSSVFSAYGMHPQSDSCASLFRRYPLAIHPYRSHSIELHAPKELPTQISSEKLKKNEPTASPDSFKNPDEPVNNTLKRKLLSALSRAAWLDHGEQIMAFLARCWPFLGRFF